MSGAALAASLAALSMAPNAMAHHSTAMFDDAKCLMLSGSLRKISMNYPHVWLWVAVKDKAGKDVTWALEATDPASLRTKGWQRTDTKPGDAIALAVHPVRDGRPIGMLVQARLADGRVIASGMSGCKLPTKP